MKRMMECLRWMVWMAVPGMWWAGTSACGASADPNTPAPSEVLRKQIQEAEIQPLFLSITTVSQMDLDALIANLDRLEVPSAPIKASADSPVVSAEAPAAEREQEKQAPPEEGGDQRASAPAAVSADADPAPVDPEWLHQIDTVTHPVDPMALGDVLFRIGQLDRAERFYRMVLEKTNLPEDLNWQWAMYQRANCLRHVRPSEARTLYEDLVTQAPGSSWSAAATAQKATLEWYEGIQKTEIKRLIGDPNDVS